MAGYDLADCIVQLLTPEPRPLTPHQCGVPLTSLWAERGWAGGGPRRGRHSSLGDTIGNKELASTMKSWDIYRDSIRADAC